MKGFLWFFWIGNLLIGPLNLYAGNLVVGGFNLIVAGSLGACLLLEGKP